MSGIFKQFIDDLTNPLQNYINSSNSYTSYLTNNFINTELKKDKLTIANRAKKSLESLSKVFYEKTLKTTIYELETDISDIEKLNKKHKVSDGNLLPILKGINSVLPALDDRFIKFLDWYQSYYSSTPICEATMTCCTKLFDYLLQLYKQEAQQPVAENDSLAISTLNSPILNCLIMLKKLLSGKYNNILENTKEYLNNLKKLEEWKYDNAETKKIVKTFIANHVDKLIADVQIAIDKKQNTRNSKLRV